MAFYTIQPGNWSGLFCTSQGLWKFSVTKTCIIRCLQTWVLEEFTGHTWTNEWSQEHWKVHHVNAVVDKTPRCHAVQWQVLHHTTTAVDRSINQYQSMNQYQSINGNNQSINRSILIDQSVNQWTNESINKIINQSNQSINQSINTDQSISQSTHQYQSIPTNQWITQSLNQCMNQWIKTENRTYIWLKDLALDRTAQN